MTEKLKVTDERVTDYQRRSSVPPSSRRTTTIPPSLLSGGSSKSSSSRPVSSSKPPRHTPPNGITIMDMDTEDDELKPNFANPYSPESQTRMTAYLEADLQKLIKDFLDQKNGNFLELKEQLLERINEASTLEEINPILIVELEVLTRALCVVDIAALKEYTKLVTNLVQTWRVHF